MMPRKRLVVKRGNEIGHDLRKAAAVACAGVSALPAPKAPRGRDPMFADEAVFAGRAPANLARNHDRYLYGEEPSSSSKR
jgi:hypothetical protein